MAGAQGKSRENTGNLVLIGTWQPCVNVSCYWHCLEGHPPLLTEWDL